MKTYSAPVLTTYGAVESLTQASGASKSQDFFILNGVLFDTTDSQTGSRNAPLKPAKPA